VGLLTLLVLTFPAGADSLGPFEEPYFEEIARPTLGLGDEPILLVGRADWLFGIDDFEFLRLGKMMPNTGVLILLKTQLVFAVWDMERSVYMRHHRIRYDDLQAVRKRSWGATRRMVVQTNRDTLHAFSYVTANGALNDSQKTERGIEIIRREAGLGPE
jgi:hypothetical protein